jgi:hypothetical protein
MDKTPGLMGERSPGQPACPVIHPVQNCGATSQIAAEAGLADCDKLGAERVYVFEAELDNSAVSVRRLIQKTLHAGL